MHETRDAIKLPRTRLDPIGVEVGSSLSSPNLFFFLRVVHGVLISCIGISGLSSFVLTSHVCGIPELTTVTVISLIFNRSLNIAILFFIAEHMSGFEQGATSPPCSYLLTMATAKQPRTCHRPLSA